MQGIPIPGRFYCGRFHLGQVGLYERILLGSPRLVPQAGVLAGSEFWTLAAINPAKEDF